MPVAHSKDLRGSTRRLLSYLGPERKGAVIALVLAIGAVVLAVSGPRLLGHATNIIVDGVTSHQGIDFDALHRQIILIVGVYLASWTLAYIQGLVLANVIQHSMQRLRSEVEDKLNRLPLATIDRTPRGDLLSRVTNDIDNLAQSLQQTMSQTLISTFTIIGVLIMMITISPLLARHHRRDDPRRDLRDQDDHRALEEALHRPVDAHRLAERPGRGGVHRATRSSGRSAASTTSATASTTRTSSCTRPASTRSSSRASCSPS